MNADAKTSQKTICLISASLSYCVKMLQAFFFIAPDMQTILGPLPPANNNLNLKWHTGFKEKKRVHYLPLLKLGAVIHTQILTLSHTHTYRHTHTKGMFCTLMAGILWILLRSVTGWGKCEVMLSNSWTALLSSQYESSFSLPAPLKFPLFPLLFVVPWASDPL